MTDADEGVVVLPIRYRHIAAHLTLFACCTVLLAYLYALTRIDWGLPMIYAGDTLSAASVMKGISENGIWWFNPMIGGRSGLFYADYPFSDALSFALVWVISLFSDHVFVIYNTFFFLTFFLAAATCLHALLQLGLHEFPAMAASLLFAFLPFHQMRYDHIFLSAYFLVPLSLLVAVRLMTALAEPAGTSTEARAVRRRLIWGSLAISLLCSSTGLYYAFFTCFFYAVALVVNLFDRRSRSAILLPLAMIGAVVAGVLLNLVPALVYFAANGMPVDSELARRQPSDAEVHALRIVQMIMPRTDHRNEALGSITERYNRLAPLVNENRTSALGLVGSAGFVGLLANLFRKWTGDRNDSSQSRMIGHFSRFNLAALLLGTMGGFGAILSYGLGFGAIRAYNRLSVYISFLALGAIAIWINTLMTRREAGRRNRLAVAASLCAVLLLVGLYDQTITVYHDRNTQAPIRVMVDSDRQFVAGIEQALEPGALVFQLPYRAFPSDGGYELMKAYLLSSRIVWSYGGMQGRPEDQWLKQVSAMAPADMVQALKDAGYRGIYVDQAIFPASDSLLLDLARVTGRQPMRDAERTKAFFLLDTPAP